MIDTLARLIPAVLDFAISLHPLYWIVIFAIVFSPCYIRTRERN